MPPVSTDSTSLMSRVKARALALGFDVVGVARASEPLDVDFERWKRFVAEGMHGAMGYLAEHDEARRRLDGEHILSGARSVICVGRRYARPAAAEDPPLARAVARYARGQDYHVFLRKKLRKLAAFARTLAPGADARAFLDTEPILERAWAARAGLGFIGKNGLLITPGQGSYQLIGEVVTTLELPPDVPMSERCGSCTRCLEACPTQAFVEPFVLDPRRCVSYWTIEQPDAPPPELREAVGEHLFGCDACQEVCPFNKAAPPDEARTGPFRPLARWAELGLADLVELSPEQWEGVASGSPIYRAGRAGMARNAALVAATRLSRGRAGADERRAVDAASRHESAPVRAIVARDPGHRD